ncbi:hypothetical protein [Shinella pollutisoli]|uniref:Uncharacterized protein n=1 Tax=Shinella pollutisoli TaxID=2250594 RepID=A0ABV7DKP0_9HYPH|nr:hypothetical protein [Shinella pollutisoli]
MPLVKIHVENVVWSERGAALTGALKPIRAMLCETFKVDAGLCQLAIIPVYGVDDQAPVAAEMQILPKPERTREVILGACERLRDMLAEASGERTVIRSTQLDPETYLALK